MPASYAAAVRLDMATGGGEQGSTSVGAGWTPIVETYLGRVTKARILQAVREAKGAAASEHIAHLKKGEMATQAQALLAGSRWLPEPRAASRHRPGRGRWSNRKRHGGTDGGIDRGPN
jgi:ParB family chromosome partitioning protein